MNEVFYYYKYSNAFSRDSGMPPICFEPKNKPSDTAWERHTAASRASAPRRTSEIDRGLWNNESGHGNNVNWSRSPRHRTKNDPSLSSLDLTEEIWPWRRTVVSKRCDPRETMATIKRVPIRESVSARKWSLIFTNIGGEGSAYVQSYAGQ